MGQHHRAVLILLLLLVLLLIFASVGLLVFVLSSETTQVNIAKLSAI